MQSRREFMRIALVGGSGLAVGWPAAAAPAEDSPRPAPLALWVLIGADDTVTLQSNATEIGQGSQSGLAQILSEELELPWGEIRIAMAPVESAYYGLFNDYVTGGSSAIRGMFEKLRVAGATARELLLLAAAKQWNVDVGGCALRDRRVVHAASGPTLRIGALAASAATMQLEKPGTPKPRDQWKVVGKDVRRLDLHDKVVGCAMFGIDAGPPESRVAVIRHAPVFGATVKSVATPASPTLQVVQLPEAVAVVGPNYWTAKQALDSLHCEWSLPENPTDTQRIRTELRQAVQLDGEIRNGPEDRRAALRAANLQAFTEAHRVFEAQYEVPLLAHACMEPMNATAHRQGDRLEMWVPTQVQASMKRDVAKAVGLAESAVTIHTTLVGGGFGRRLATDYGVQAALIAGRVDGPVKLIWSREEDLQHDCYRQAAMARFSCAFDAAGEMTAVRGRLAALGRSSPGGMPWYTLPHFMITNNDVATRIPLGAWRAIESNHNTFFLESFIDELSAQLRVSPLQLRRRLLASNPRVLRVLEAAVAASGMERPAQLGRHFGVAMAMVFGSLSAHVVEVSVAGREFRVHKVTCALDCGTAVNPDSVRAQIEGSVLMGLSAACFEEITLTAGRVDQSNLHDYQTLRCSQTPAIEAIIVESPGEALGGCGEPALPPLAPALTNALYAASGERVRALPLARQGWALA
jgi:isoquinoline 1-oxidoreductase beta subunit